MSSNKLHLVQAAAIVIIFALSGSLTGEILPATIAGFMFTGVGYLLRFVLKKRIPAKAWLFIKVCCFALLGLLVLGTAMNPNRNKTVKPIAAMVATPKANKTTVIAPAKIEKLEAVELPDCKIALQILNDLEPVANELSLYIQNNPEANYQNFNNWKQSANFTGRISAIQSKYPSSFKLDQENARASIGLVTRVELLANEVFSHLRHSPGTGHKQYMQAGIITSDWEGVLGNCKDELSAR
jgi:endonuclease/exonuclease/phosphatase (EEP) superfamily protein YafD